MAGEQRRLAGCPLMVNFPDVLALKFSFIRSRATVETDIHDVDVVQVITAKAASHKCFI